jgi:tRNA A37 threonylcarbamoyladenosine biosynthesis protein TsaE
MSQVQTYNLLKLNDEQEAAMAMLKEFVGNDGQVFLLKGYAGTGKTTIIKELINYLSLLNKSFELMAPTGRAAKILRD